MGERRGMAFVASAALLWSTGGLVVRSLEMADAMTTVFWRAATACVFLLLFVVARERGGWARSFAAMGRPGLVVSVCYAIASTSLVVAFDLTSVANTLVIMSSAPLLAAVLGWIVLGERVRLASWFALLASVAGIGLMVSESYERGSIAGDLVAMVIAVAQAVAGVTIRRHRTVHMAPAMCASTLVTALAVAPLASPLAVTAADMALLAFFGAGQLGLGRALFSFGAPLMPVVGVALLNVLEPVFGPLWVWLVLGERPGDAALAGGAIVLAALAVHILSDAARRRG
jgi:drug/metabolite transporter (DMT)-like permease